MKRRIINILLALIIITCSVSIIQSDKVIAAEEYSCYCTAVQGKENEGVECVMCHTTCTLGGAGETAEVGETTLDEDGTDELILGSDRSVKKASASDGKVTTSTYKPYNKDDDEATKDSNTKDNIDTAKNDVKNIGSKFIAADTGKASRALNGVASLIQLFSGILVYLTILGMTLFTGFDLLYITMPAFRELLGEEVAKGNKAVAKQGKDGEFKMRWVTDEAVFCVQNAATLESGKSPLATYLGKRAFSFVAIMIIIFILLTGNINLITDVALNFISGIINVLVDLGKSISGS